ncbi:MAG: DnaJ domain-containing protein [Niabella sp.]|nr:DnaJ domain-containing protein [Niabella sp.]
MKDYYAILGVKPSATLKELKSAYRALALQYHPDKNPTNAIAATRFQLITEAYQTLTTPQLKEAYLQNRWLNKAMGAAEDTLATTPPQLLNEVLKTNQAVATADAYRVDKKALFNEMTALIDDEKIFILNKAGQETLNHEIVRWMVDSTHIIRYTDRQAILAQLKKIHAGPEALQLIEQKEGEVRAAILWSRLQPVLIVLIIILLCIAIAYSG